MARKRDAAKTTTVTMTSYGSTTKQDKEDKESPAVSKGGNKEDTTTAKAGDHVTSLDVTGNASFSEQDTSPSSGRFPPLLLPLVPEVSPLAWTVINNTLAISGCLLILDIWYANQDGTPLEERPFAEAYQLIWEFTVCFFWTAESALSASYQYCHLHTPLQWYNWLELTIAVYFLFSTAWMLWQWNLSQYDFDSIWEIALVTSFYVYLAIRSCKRTTASATTTNEERSTSTTTGTDDDDDAAMISATGSNFDESVTHVIPYRRMSNEGIWTNGVLV